MDAEIARIEKDVARNESGLKESRKELENVRISTTRLSEYKDTDRIIEKSSADAKELKEAHSKLNSQIEGLAKERDALNKLLGDLSIKLDALKRKEKYEIEISQSKEHLGKKNSEMNEIKFDEKELYRLQELITKESSLLGQMKEKILSNQRHLKGLDAQIEDKLKGIATST